MGSVLQLSFVFELLPPLTSAFEFRFNQRELDGGKSSQHIIIGVWILPLELYYHKEKNKNQLMRGERFPFHIPQITSP